MKQLSVKYSITSNGFETRFIVHNNAKYSFEIFPYNYIEKDILGREITRKKLLAFIEHLQNIANVKR